MADATLIDRTTGPSERRRTTLIKHRSLVPILLRAYELSGITNEQYPVMLETSIMHAFAFPEPTLLQMLERDISMDDELPGYIPERQIVQLSDSDDDDDGFDYLAKGAVKRQVGWLLSSLQPSCSVSVHVCIVRRHVPACLKSVPNVRI
eukprot:6201623-Pleurochrysis_carterae.AAC.1